MSGIDGGTLREWRRSRGWDVPGTARRLRRAAGQDALPDHDALVRMIRRWERVGLRTERYELLYRALGFAEQSRRAAPRWSWPAICRAAIPRARREKSWPG